MAQIPRMIALAASAAAVGCGGGKSLDSNEIKACASKGVPVTIAKLVQVFRANGITLDINQLQCERPDSTEPEATNGGPLGLESSEEIVREEGYLLCRVGRGSDPGEDRQVHVVKYPTDKETHLDALNVSCSVYPYDAASEREQVARVEAALRELIRVTPTN